jgi:type I restriction enzyme S subunit
MQPQLREDQTTDSIASEYRINNLPAQWEFLPVKRLSTLKEDAVLTGPFGSLLHSSDYVKKGIPLVLIKNIQNGQIIETDIPKISEKDAERLSRYSLKPGDIIFSRVGRVGSAALALQKHDGWIISGQTLRIRFGNPKINSAYINYFIQSKIFAKLFQPMLVGTTRESINTTILENVPIIVPPLEEQKKIASILSEVDELIQKTDQIIERTRRLKKSLMQKLLIKGIGHKDYKKMRFGFRFMKVEIPSSWNLLPLSEVSLDGLQNGIFKKREEYGQGVPLVNVSDLFSTDDIDIDKLERVSVNKDEIKQFGIEEGDIFFCRSSLVMDGIGRSNIVTELTEPSVFECHVMMLRPDKQKIYPKFLAYYAQSKTAKTFLYAVSMTLTMTTIRQPDLEQLPVPIPSLEEQQKIVMILSSIDSQIQTQHSYSLHLETIKKGLIQKLLTGKIRAKI